MKARSGTMMIPGNALFFDLLRLKNLPSGVSTSELSHLEGDSANPWRWALGDVFELKLTQHLQPFELRLEFLFAGFEQSISIFLEDRLLEKVELSLSRNRAVFRTLFPAADCGKTLRLVPSRWNKNGSCVPGDKRSLSICFTELRLIHQAMAQGGICAMPFTRKEIKGGGAFVPCCSPWLSQKYFEIPSGANSWNGPQAKALRESVLDGSYRFCRRDLCQTQYFFYDQLPGLRDPAGEFVLSEANLDAVQSGRLDMPEGPSAATVTADSRCNLACPSCRAGKISVLDELGAKRIALAKKEIADLAPSIMRLRISGDGEPLFSPFLRDLIQSLDEKNFPNLKIIELHTNGIFLDKKNLASLEPGAAKINRVYVSIDAGDEAVYRKVRGGDWNRLQKNLQWASEQRRAGRFESLILLFVYGKENFRSMPEFSQLARKLGVDATYFSPILDWERAELHKYHEVAVHLPAHPEHEKFCAIKASLQDADRVFFSG